MPHWTLTGSGGRSPSSGWVAAVGRVGPARVCQTSGMAPAIRTVLTKRGPIEFADDGLTDGP
ncbi:MAG TPA: hypothetical protein PLB21_00565, partial [Actinomycetota bacterium]|nr:hypothetical protein [Actinomycetota bacterium]